MNNIKSHFSIYVLYDMNTLDFKGKIQKKLDCMGLFIYNMQGLCRYLYVFV